MRTKHQPKHPPGHAALLLTLVVICGATVSIHAAAAEVGDREPIEVSEDELKTLALVTLVLRPNYSSDVLVASEGLLSSVAMEFKAYSYNIVGTADEGIFEAKDKTKAQMLLGGTINDLHCETVEGYRDLEECGISILWELFDNERDEVVYRALTRHRREISLDDDHIEVELRALFRGAIRSLLARDRFVDLMRRQPRGETGPVKRGPRYPAAEFARCEAGNIKLPAEMKQAMKATVVVKVGSVVGSGFFISGDGFLLTANHVVEGVDEVELKDENGRSFEASVVRRDRKSDVALLKADIKTSDCLPLATAAPDVGTEVYGIGAPGGEELAFSVSRGIVSGLRQADGHAFVQTDASINPGNSGGPLLDSKGRVIGIVSFKVAIEGFEGLGFGVAPSAALESLAISPGSSSNVEGTAEPAATPGEQDEADDVRDRDDPVYTLLPLEQTERQKLRVFTYKQRKLYSPLRYAMLIGAPVLAVSGAIMGVVSWSSYKDATGTYDYFAGAASEGDDPIDQGKFDRLRALNIAGWSIAAVGIGVGIIYGATGKDQETLEAEYPEPQTARLDGRSGRLVEPLSLSVHAGPGGVLIQGSF